MSRFFLALVAVISFFLSSCASYGPRYSETESVHKSIPPGAARVYFLRESRALFFARSAPIKIDEKEMGSLGNGGFFFVDLPPGKHLMSTKTWDAGRFSIELTTEADKIYYIEVVPRSEFFAKGVPFVVLSPLATLIGAQVVENNGMFALVPVDGGNATQKLPDLRYSK